MATLPSSGVISFKDMNVALNIPRDTRISINQASVRTLLDVKTGTIKLRRGYGKKLAPAIVSSGVSGTSSIVINGVTYTQNIGGRSLSRSSSYIINSSKKLYAWGEEIGNNSILYGSLIPLDISNFGSLSGQTIAAVAGGNFHAAVLDTTGAIHTFGNNGSGQLGTGSLTQAPNGVPVNISSIGSLSGRTIIAIACGGSHTLALDSLGEVHAWGSVFWGQLGNGVSGSRSTPRSTPQNVSGFGSLVGKTIRAIACGGDHSMALDSLGAVHTWGEGGQGVLGNNAGTTSSTPLNVSTFGSLSGRTIVAICAGSQSVALDTLGQVHTWGYGAFGSIGNNTTEVLNLIPVNISGFGSLATLTTKAISCGDQHIIALTTNNKVHTWGDNSSGQLGINSLNINSVPIEVSLYGSLVGKTIVSISAGSAHSIAIDSTNSIHTWGYNEFGQLGNNSIDNSLIPINLGILPY